MSSFEVCNHLSLNISWIFISQRPPTYNQLLGVRQLPDITAPTMTDSPTLSKAQIQTQPFLERSRNSKTASLAYINNLRAFHPMGFQLGNRDIRVPFKKASSPFREEMRNCLTLTEHNIHAHLRRNL